MDIGGGGLHHRRSVGRRMRSLLADVPFALRRFWRRGSFPGVLVALGLGVGANGATLTLAAALLVTAPDYVQDPQRLVVVPSIRSYAEYKSVSRRAKTIDLAAVTRVDLSLGVGRDADRVSVECVTRRYFDLFRYVRCWAAGSRSRTRFGTLRCRSCCLTVPGSVVSVLTRRRLGVPSS